MSTIFDRPVFAGWGGYRVLQDIDKRRYDVTMISPVRVLTHTTLSRHTYKEMNSLGTLILRHCWPAVRSARLNFVVLLSPSGGTGDRSPTFRPGQRM